MDVDEKLKEWLVKQNAEGSKRHKPLADNEFYASSAGMCPRLLYLQKKFGQKTPSPELLKIFAMGNLVHEFIQDNLFDKEGNEVPAVLEIDGIKVRGRMDHLDDDYVWELKSVGNIAYCVNEPKENNVFQVMIYMKALGRDKGRLVYIEKNSLKIITHNVPYSEDVLQKAISGFIIVRNALRDGFIPERKSGFPHCFDCNYCDWVSKCGDINND